MHLIELRTRQSILLKCEVYDAVIILDSGQLRVLYTFEDKATAIKVINKKNLERLG